MIVEYYQKHYEPFDEAIAHAKHFHEKVKRFVVNQKELLEFWYFLYPDRKTITVMYGSRGFSDTVEESLHTEVQGGFIKLDYLGIPVVYKASA